MIAETIKGNAMGYSAAESLGRASVKQVLKLVFLWRHSFASLKIRVQSVLFGKPFTLGSLQEIRSTAFQLVDGNESFCTASWLRYPVLLLSTEATEARTSTAAQHCPMWCGAAALK
uniref:Uncharacterized protein n=1 Tax=Eutreptiella gymnastica TaxID=73025 RepID=A0A7S4G6E1_9EUGL|mmetsp:Transcript_35504/g.57970  ORF Transcript_35504/g.57970 Transcript_35504/m.57970 type:complete len:116 (-) Transcript_35504:206-553(-)